MALLALPATVEVAADDGSDEQPAAEQERSTVTVRRQTLSETIEIPASLGFGERRELLGPAAGTATSLPPLGSEIDFGQEVARVDDRPVVLLEGDVPSWRDLGPGVADGPDVEQVEAALVEQGYADPDQMNVDGDWTATTTRAVRRWQDALGVDDDGRLPLGSVVFSPSPLRIADHLVEVGARVTGPLLTATGVDQTVVAALDVGDRNDVAVGQAVIVELSDDASVDGTVAAIGSVARSAGPVPATVELTVVPSEPIDGLDEAPVTIVVEQTIADGTTELISVEIGASANGDVAIFGAVDDGDQVVVA